MKYPLLLTAKTCILVALMGFGYAKALPISVTCNDQGLPQDLTILSSANPSSGWEITDGLGPVGSIVTTYIPNGAVATPNWIPTVTQTNFPLAVPKDTDIDLVWNSGSAGGANVQSFMLRNVINLSENIDPSSFRFTLSTYSDDNLSGMGINNSGALSDSVTYDPTPPGSYLRDATVVFENNWNPGNNTIYIHANNEWVGNFFVNTKVESASQTNAQCNLLAHIYAPLIGTQDAVTGISDPKAQISVVNTSNQTLCTAIADNTGNWSCTPNAPVTSPLTAEITFDSSRVMNRPNHPVSPIGTPAISPTVDSTTCTAIPDSGLTASTSVQITCLGDPGAKVTIAGTDCSSGKVFEASGAVTCTGTASSIGSSPIATLTNNGASISRIANSGKVKINFSTPPDLSLSLNTIPSSATEGAHVVAALIVKNEGLTASSDGELSMSIPSGLEIDTASLPSACASSTAIQLKCNLSPLAPNATQNFSIQLKVKAKGTYSLSALVSLVTGETALANNRAQSSLTTLSFLQNIPANAPWTLVLMALFILSAVMSHLSRQVKSGPKS